MSCVGLDVSALDPAFKDHAHRGIGRYVRELDRYFRERAGGSSADDGERALMVQAFSHRGAVQGGPWIARMAQRIIDMLPCGRATLTQQMLFPLSLSSLRARCRDGGNGAHGPRFDLLHFPAHMDAPAWGLTRYAITVLDLIPLVCADLYRAQKSGLRFRLARYLELQAIRNASLILAISENTAKDVERVLSIPRERIFVTPLGVDERFYRASRPQSPDDFLLKLGIGAQQRLRPIVLYVGGIDPRKNWGVLLESFAELLAACKERGHEQLPLLLMAGNISGDHEYPKLIARRDSLQLQDHVHFLGFVPDDILLQLFAITRIFFFASLYEGFGLPPLEAMAAGVPVVSSNASAMPEVLGEAALYFEPRDACGAARHMLDILENRMLAESLRARGRHQARFFTWQKTGDSTREAYLSVLAPPQAKQETARNRAASRESDNVLDCVAP